MTDILEVMQVTKATIATSATTATGSVVPRTTTAHILLQQTILITTIGTAITAVLLQITIMIKTITTLTVTGIIITKMTGAWSWIIRQRGFHRFD